MKSPWMRRLALLALLGCSPLLATADAPATDGAAETEEPETPTTPTTPGNNADEEEGEANGESTPSASKNKKKNKKKGKK